jgi:hypothetical protein
MMRMNFYPILEAVQLGYRARLGKLAHQSTPGKA